MKLYGVKLRKKEKIINRGHNADKKNDGKKSYLTYKVTSDLLCRSYKQTHYLSFFFKVTV